MEISRRIVTYALFLFSLLVSTIFSIDISACANLNTQGTTYTLISSISTNALSCFNITAENVTFNLNGFLINGTKQANSIGIYTTAKNSTITNGIIDGFEKGVYLANTQLGTIDNITAMTSVAGGKGIFLSNVNSITIINSNGTSSSSNGIYISSSNYNQIINSTAYSQSSYAIYVDSSTYNNVTGSVGYTSSLDTGRGIYVWSSNFTTIKYSAGRAYFGIGIDSGQNNSIINSNGTSSSYCGICIRFSSSGNSIITSNGTTSSTTVSGIYISSSNYNQIINSTSTSTSYFGLELTDSSWNNITGSNISTHSQTKSGLKLTNADNSIIANNTIGGNPPSNKACINISSTSSDNLFYHNELYNCLTYIDNQNDTNLFNTTSNGIAQGNYYQNILGLPIYDTDNDGWGDYGSGYPLSASTQGGNWTGYGQDWGPRGATVDPSLLGSCSNLTSPGTTYTLIRNITNWTSGTCFYISAENVTLNGAGYTIVGDNITGSHGISINASNVVVANITIYNFTTHLGIYGYTRNVSIDNVKLMHAKNRAGGHNLYIDWTVNNTKINKVNSSVLISNGGEPFLHAGYIRGFNHTINNSFFQGRGWAGLWLSASNCTIENTETQTWYYLALFIDGPNNRFNNLTSFSSSGVGVAIRYPNAVVNNSHIKVTGYNGAFTVGYSGGYKVDGTIIENTVINQTNIPAGSGSANAFDVNLANQTTLKNLTVESNGGYAFIVRDSYNNNVENVRVYSKRNMSLYIEKAGNITILNSEFIANSSEGVYLSYSQNVTLQNVYANSTSSTGIYIYNSQNITLANVTGESAGIYPAFGLKASETSLNITGSTIRGIGENATYGLGVFYSPSVNITNSLITSNKGIALWIANLTSGAIQNSTINSSNNVGLYLENSTNGSIRYVNISSGLQLAVNLSNTSSFVFENNTISSPTTCINISSTSSDNLFYHNELYNCTTYIDNKNETNLFNTTASGTAQGNYYQNILGLPIYDTDNDGWGDYGSGYPLSASTQGGNWTGYGQDWGPRASSQAAPPSLTPLYPENNSLFIDTTLINFTFYVENPVGEVSCAVIINGTTYNESTPAQHNSNLTIWRNLPNGNYSWQPYCNNSFSLSSTGAQSIFSINISGGQIPEISNLTCSNETGIYKNCTEFVYGEKIVNISLSCTDPNNNIVRASYLLTNEPDTIALINTSNATVVVLTDWIAEVNHTINDSGDFNLTASCIDEYGNTANITNNWSIPWGHLAASVVSHSSNASVVQGEFFTFTARVTCLGGECGGVEATLDPIELPLFGNITILDDISELASNLIHQLKTPEDERKEGFVILNVIGEEVNISKKETQDQNHIQNISAENQQIKYGSILVYSTPENATIYLNESPIGVTPLVIGNLSEANYSLRLEKSGFASYYLPSVEVILGQNTSINVNLQILKSTENVSQQLTVVFTLKNTSKGGEYTITNGTDGKFNITFVKRQDAATTGSAISPPQRAALYRIAESVPQPKVELYGVVPGEVKVVIDYVDDSRIKTDVVAVSNITIESAKIILPTEDKVDAILHCPNFDQESFSCPEWKATQIPFVQYPTYIEFNVSSFSGYAGGLLNESYLVIWSETNPRMPYGGKSRAAGQEIKFLANYTQGQVGDVIGPSEGTCIIQFKKQADPDSYYTVPLQMSFNSTSSLYENHSILAENTSYTFRVSCNSSEYKSQNTTDNIILPTTKTGAISTVQGAFPFYTISPNPQTNCTSLKKDESCTFSWNVNATGNLFTIHAFFVDFNTTNYSSFVSNTRTEIINITISVYDISPPVVVDTSITPKIASNGSQVYLYATVTDNVQVDKMWANITLPNSSMVEISSIPTTYVTPQIYGRYNITFYANDTAGNTANASDYFEVSEPVQFHFSTLTANQSDLYVNMTFLYPNSTAIVKNLLGNSSFVVELSESILDLKTKSFNGSFNITFMEINVSRENGGNLQMDLFAYAPSGDLNFKGGVAFNTSLNFTNADISFSYSWLNLSLSDEQNAVLYKCSKWDFEKSICLSSWIVANATKVLENDIYLLTETSSDPAYLIVIKPYCGDGVCHYSVGENCATCSEDCGICPGEPLKTFSVVARIGCAGTKSVIIVEYAGSPLQDASYSIREEGRIGGNIIASGRTDKNGKIAFVPPTQGQYSLSLSKTDFYPFSRIYSVSCTKEKEEPQCLSSLDCPSGYLCEGRKCVQIVLNQTLPDLACLADSDCKKGEICVGGFCIRASCDDDSQCLDNQYCSWGRCLQISGKCGYAANHTWINYECCSSLDCKEGEECIDNRCVISPLILKQEAQKEIEEAKKALNEATGKETRQAYEELNNALYAFSKGNYEEALKLAKASKLSAKNAPPKTLIPKPPSPSQLPYYSVLFGAAYVLVLFAAISVGSLLALMVILLRKHKVSTLQVRYYPELEIAAKRKLEVKVEEAPPEPLFPTIDLAQVFWSHQAKVVYGIMFVALLVSVSLLYLFQTKEGIISIEQQEYIIEIDAIYSVLSIIAGGLIVSVIYLTSQYISLRPYKPIHTTEAVAREPQTLPSQRVIVLPHISMPSIRISLPPIHLPHIRLSIPIPRIVIPQFHLYAPLIRVPILRIPKIKVRAPVFRVPKMRIEIPHLYLPHIRIILPRIVVPEVHPPKPLIQLSVPRIKVSHILPTYRLNLLELAYELLAFVLFAFSSGLMLISSVVGMQPIVIDAEYMVIELNTLLLLYAISIFGIFGSVAMFVSRKLLIEEKPYWVLAIALVVFIAIILAVAAFISGTETYSIIGTTLLSSLDSASTYANNLFASIYLVNANYTGTNHEKAERIPFYPLNRDGQVFPQNRYAVSPFTYIYYIVPPNKSDKFLHSAIISDAYFASQFVSYPLVGEPLSFSLGSCPSLTYSTHSISIRGESNSEFKLCVKEKDGTFHEILLQFGYEKDRLYLISK